MHDVIIVGAGPVGLFLGALLLQEGLSVRILEQRSTPSSHSRAIGVHPPALTALGQAGVAADMVAEGVQIDTGIARSSGREVTRLSFAQLSAEHPYVLTLPQVRTEALLEARVRELDPSAIVRGWTLNSVQDSSMHNNSMHDDGTFVTLSGSPTAGPTVHQARLAVGADGARSSVRRQLRIPTGGRNYPDTYLMGDFPDSGRDGSAAVLFLEPAGIVESFPLPGGLRRWVAHTQWLRAGATAADLVAIVRDRTGIRLDVDANTMLSAFGVRSRLAGQMVAGRVVLVGDAAHEISPIGGQGMNLGWLDAVELAPIIVSALAGHPTGLRLAEFQRNRMRAARWAERQAWLNMALGRAAPASFLAVRHAVLREAFRLSAVSNLVARRFTMQ